MAPARIVALTTLALLAFAGNSLLCRSALRHTATDPASFTSLRLVSAALVLWLLLRLRRGSRPGAGNWGSALALFTYAACFSFAYGGLSAATGALLLFGAVQTTMIGYGLRRGERLRPLQGLGLALACAGLLGLLLPGLAAPPLSAALLMLAAGMAWGVYSLRGRGAGDPLQVTAGNFLRTVPITALLSLALLGSASVDLAGAVLAVCSGALASAIGYAIWYTALPALQATHAATVQLSVPVLAAVGGTLFLGEAPSLRLLAASVAILGGIALIIVVKPVAKATDAARP